MRKFLHLIVLCLLTSYLQAQTPGVSIFYQQTTGDTRNYIEYIPGNLPIIISAPHGGVQQSGQTIGGIFYPDNDSSLPDRNCGTNERDDNTDILIREIQKEIFQLTGCYAHVIINNLHRSKLDPNREINEASCGNSNAVDHWNAFHNFIDQASTSVESNWGKGLYIDLHGQSHAIPRIEVGYNITRNELNTSNLNAASIINKSTIRNLVNTNLNNLSHEELIRGNTSLGELFQNTGGAFYASQGHAGCENTTGYRAVPSATNNGGGSCDDTRPNGNAYFDGDFYNNRRHGSGSGTTDGTGGDGNIDGIMTEVNRRVRDLGTYNGQVYDSRPQTLVPFAKDYAAVVLNYIDAHYNDFAMFAYLSSTYARTNSNPTPIITGVSGGTFSSPSGIIVNPATGEIDVANSSLGDHSVLYTVGTCGYYTYTQNITIVEDISDDIQPPTDPSDLVAVNTTQTTTDLSWTASTDDVDVTAYDVYQNDVIIASISQFNYIVTGLTPNTTYEFKVIARDLAGNESQPSNLVNVTTDENIVIDYCDSQSNNVNDEYISRVQLETIDNTSDARFYSDFTNLSTELIRNGQYTITVTPTWTGNVYNEAYSVWIDYNQNGDFSDPGEQVWTQGNTTATSVSGTFTIPTAATNGATRLRVSMKYNGIPTPCETFTYGEVEDYMVNIMSSVPDSIAPIITLIGDNPVNLFVGDTYTDEGATAIDNIDGDISNNIIVTGTVNTAVAGTYTLFYNVRDVVGNEAVEVTRTVNVSTPVDTTAPIITLNGEGTINLNVGDFYTEFGATATDNVDGNLTNAIITSGIVNTAVAGIYTIRYNVSDAAGNAATEATRTVNVIADTTAPVIALNGNQTINLNIGDAYTELGATATDNIDGNLTPNISIGGTVDTSTAGTYQITYTVSDAAGNTTEIIRTIHVIADTTPPVITLNGNATINLNVGDAYTELGATATDNLDGNLTTTITITGTVNTAVAGTYTVSYTVSDSSGNTTQVSRTVNVIADTTAPVITLNGNATINLNVGDAYAELGATATDNIDGNLTTAIIISGTVNTAVAGTYTIRYNVSDTAGNAATQVTRTVNVYEVSIGCTNGINTFPYTQGFENTLGGWTQSSADDIDWTVLSNGTPSQNTGPSSAIEGNFYAYVEASGNGTGYPDKQAILTSPCFDLTSLNQATFSFNYHMFGTDMGTLDVEISEDNGATWATIWNQTGNQGNAWQTTNIDLTAYVGSNVQLRFNRVTGSTWRADIAIDNIRLLDEEITVESCSGGINTFPYTESYENTLGSWTQSSEDDINWTVDANGTPSNNTGPSNAANGNFYIFVEASGNGTGFPNKQAIINSPCYDLTDELNASFSFSYHMFGSTDMGTIALEASKDNGLSWTAIWAASGNKGNQWLTANVDLSDYIGGSVQLRFNRVTGGTWQADVAIDNINLNTTTLPRQEATNTKDDTTTVSEDGNEVLETKNTLTVFPNPVKGSILNIKLDFGAVISYRIINVYGQEVSKGEEATQLNVSKLRSGVYFIEIFDGNKTLTKKFMKQ
ncbi:immunoglobulin-like domain-containing protein [Kordia sp.]|uniref:immunoglobulin-like domain-containing protein n=1 Tax=Kordia sp. TaxID=1965332 RepID=UPI003D28C764